MISKILLYIIAIGFGLFFALYMSAEVGWTFVYVLVCAPIFSFLVTLAIHKLKCVTIRADVSRSMLYKREKAVLKIYLKNRSLLPVPTVRIRLSEAKNLSTEDSLEYIVSIPPRTERIIEVEYTAKVWGVCSVGAEKAVLWDFMGFFSFAMSCAGVSREMRIFPDIPEIPGDAPLLRSAAEAAKFADDNEETKESDGFVRFGGMPGYTHKEYEDGDPVRRINWKLSSKRDKYMVRLDDEVESIQQTIVLDVCGGADALLNERAVEGMLAAALGLVKCGFETTVYCRFGGVFTAFEIADPADVSALQTKMAEYRFADLPYKGERIPTELVAGKGILLYTPLLDERLSAELALAEGQGITAVVITSDGAFSGNAAQVWRLNEDYSAELIN
ncbi:MAG: DUF58 domain-containing protein [Ruminococcus sp.]|nr:DUF58 domain-containing protein [Ruminococcus sp.]MCM1380490.1 DUF58 domain-containing protein [Muribaculaceae bacterium]